MNNLLLTNIPKYMKNIHPEEIISAGSSGLEEVFSGSELLGARRSYIDGLHGSWAMGIALFGLTFLCTLIPKRGGKVPRPGEKGGKDDQGNCPRVFLWLSQFVGTSKVAVLEFDAVEFLSF